MTTTQVQYTAARPRLCEGDDPRCRNEITMTWAAYKQAREVGNVVCSACVPNGARVVRFVPGGAVIAL